MKFKLLIFDLDGTIADTIYSIRDAVNMTMEKYSFPCRSYEQVRMAIGNGARELIRLSLPVEVSENAELVDRVLADYEVLYGQTHSRVKECYPYIKEVLSTLKERGYILAVLSNKQDRYVKGIIRSLLENGEISHAQGQTALPKKPDPTVPLMIADSFCVLPTECAFIGDSEVDVKTAKNAGMTAVACSWGYREREVLADADYIIDDARELLQIFKPIEH